MWTAPRVLDTRLGPKIRRAAGRGSPNRPRVFRSAGALTQSRRRVRRLLSHDRVVEALHTLLRPCFFGGRPELWRPFDHAVRRLAGVPADLALLRDTFRDPVRTAQPALGRLDKAVTGLGQETDRVRILYLSHRTVATHVYQIFPKLGVTSRAALRVALSGSGSPSRSARGRRTTQSWRRIDEIGRPLDGKRLS
jgi:hypothetical protein